MTDNGVQVKYKTHESVTILLTLPIINLKTKKYKYLLINQNNGIKMTLAGVFSYSLG